MTIKVTIKNEEQEGGKSLSVYIWDAGADDELDSADVIIAPGESKEFVVHGLRSLEVFEADENE